MKKLGMLIVLIAALFSNGHCLAWFEVQAIQFPRIEMLPNKQIIMYRPNNTPAGILVTSFYPVGQESATIDMLTFTPPTGMESQFLSLLLTALTSKKKLLIEGHIATGTSVIGSARVQIE